MFGASYITSAEADAYLVGNAMWLALDQTDKERRLWEAMVWLNATYDWVGHMPPCDSDDQASGYATGQYDSSAYGIPVQQYGFNQWPRVDDHCGCGPMPGMTTGAARHAITGCELVGVPDEVKYATALAAGTGVTTSLFAGAKAATTTSGGSGALTKRRIKAGSVEIERQFGDGQSSVSTSESGRAEIPYINALLQGIGTVKGSVTSGVSLLQVI